MNTSNLNRLEKDTLITNGGLISLLFSIYFFLSFYEGYINIIFGSITKYYILVLMLIMILRYKNIKIQLYQILILFWLMFKITSILWGSSITTGVSMVGAHLLSQVGMVSFLIILSVVPFDKKFVSKMINATMYSSGSLALLGLFFSEPYLGSFTSRQTLTLFGVQMDPNDLSALYLVGITIALYFLIYEKKRSLDIFSIILINSLAMGLTGSRGGFLSLLAVIVVYIFINNVKKGVFQIIKKLLVFSFLLIILYSIIQRFLPEGILQRLFEFETYEGGSDRSYLWGITFEYFKQSPFFGYGWGSVNLRTHNTYLTALIDTGIIGFALLVSPIIIICFRAIKQRQPLVIALLVAGLAPSFFLDAINKRFFWNAIILAILIINNHTYFRKLK